MIDNRIKVSVVMGVYNQWDRKGLLQAVKSILNQTLTEFEFIIYDDGSYRELRAYIQDLAKLDKRIKVFGREQNHGLAFSLNACISCAKGKYIARMDADDVSHPSRLQVQYDFLEAHPEYAWCGCNTKLFDADGEWGCREMPECPMPTDYLRFSPYVHPSVMYRSEIFEENVGYLDSKETLRCEDYEIFMRLCQMGLKGYNIQRYLFSYREDHESYKRREFIHRWNESKLRFKSFKKMHILFPIGWLYVLRPIIAGLIPTYIIAWVKHRESQNTEMSYRSVKWNDEQKIADIQRYTQ